MEGLIFGSYGLTTAICLLTRHARVHQVLSLLKIVPEKLQEDTYCGKKKQINETFP